MFAKFIPSAFLFFALTQGAMAVVCGDPPVFARMPFFFSLPPMQEYRILLPYTRKPVPPRGLGVSQNQIEELKKSTEVQGGGS
ncbi:hypothetical protein DFH09DRAFT_1305114 [Mycena vulgaris]|nr:hypothetical protein DFH09DRAFT_1305114 [Mycena vulgaris]